MSTPPESLCPSCGSCGYPMREANDFAGGLAGSVYCSTCGDAQGQLLPYEEVLQANAHYLVTSQGLHADAARELARALLATMPAWKSS